MLVFWGSEKVGLGVSVKGVPFTLIIGGHNSWVESVVLGRFLIRMCRIGCKQVKVVILRACEDGPRNGVGAGG